MNNNVKTILFSVGLSVVCSVAVANETLLVESVPVVSITELDQSIKQIPVAISKQISQDIHQNLKNDFAQTLQH